MNCAKYYVSKLMVVLILLAMATVKAQELTRAERPDVKVGDRWVFKTKNLVTGDEQLSTSTVVEIADNKIVVQRGNELRISNRELNYMEAQEDGKVVGTATPEWPTFKFPLEIGKKWEGRWEGTNRTLHLSWTGSSVVEAIKTVTVPAGTFQAVKLKMTANYVARTATGATWRGPRTEIFWYVPTVKRVVKVELQEWRNSDRGGYTHREVSELQSYSVAP